MSVIDFQAPSSIAVTMEQFFENCSSLCHMLNNFTHEGHRALSRIEVRNCPPGEGLVTPRA